MTDQTKPINILSSLDGIPFPASKVEILVYAGEHETSEEVMELLRALPTKQYQNMNEINAALGTVKEEAGSENLFSSRKSANG